MKFLNTIAKTLPLIIIILASSASAETDVENYDYEFDVSETEKEPFSFGGHVELSPFLNIADRESAFYRLKYYDNDQGREFSGIDLSAEPEAVFEKDIFKIFIRAHGNAGYADNDWQSDITLYEGYAAIMPIRNIAIDAGKKTLKWGKGYAWNPVAFADRPKNPDDPELAFEGFYLAAADLIMNFSGSLKTISFTPAAIPSFEKINNDFGKTGHWNFAGRLYLLFFDTDIDLLFLKGKSRGDRFGIDASRNITNAFEIHIEYAFIPNHEKRRLDSGGIPRIKKYNASIALAGIRYLTETETTFIIEYYYNGTGMSESEMSNYYDFIDNAHDLYLSAGNTALLEKAETLTRGNYGKMNPMRNYIYLHASQNEPFDILYFTPALNVIYNADDKSFSLTPETLYKGITNLELRLRYTLLYGKDNSEYGEKPADHRFDARARYYF